MSLRSSLLAAIVGGASFITLPLAGQAEPATLEDRLAGCGKCHAGRLALTGKPPEQLLDSINKIREGSKRHPPGLDAFADEELEEVASILSGVVKAE